MMKTKWGSCNAKAGRVWFNRELAQKPVACLEYVVVHGLAHLRERSHTELFTALMDGFLPNWRICRERLNGGCCIGIDNELETLDDSRSWPAACAAKQKSQAKGTPGSDMPKWASKIGTVGH